MMGAVVRAGSAGVVTRAEFISLVQEK